MVAGKPPLRMGGAGDAVCIAGSSEVESYLLDVPFYLTFYLKVVRSPRMPKRSSGEPK